MNTEERQALQRFVIGKCIEGLRFGEEDPAEASAEGPGLEILFDDGSELELFCLLRMPRGELSCTLGWVYLAPGEVPDP
jgi:hypothetical protein